ncbi:MAG TPA: DMT family transporter [Clostridiales bacterium]|nr:DMT family transporter [Clostridiales bacterium]
MGSFDTEKKAMAAAFFASFVFGLSFVFSKVALQFTAPLVLLAFRFVTAFLLLHLLLLTGKVKLSLRGKKLLPLILLGFLQPVLYFVFENYGILLTSATFSAVMIALIPIATLFGGILFLREIPTLFQVIFSVLSVAGVTLMALLQRGGGTVTALGVLLLLGAVLVQSGYTALTRKLSLTYSVFERTYLMFLTGCAIFVPAAVISCGFDFPLLLSYLRHPEVWSATVFLGAFCSFGAFLALNYANSHLPVARTTAFANISTLVSVFAGVILLKESFTFWTLTASLMIVAGVWGVQKFKRKEEKEESGYPEA